MGGGLVHQSVCVGARAHTRVHVRVSCMHARAHASVCLCRSCVRTRVCVCEDKRGWWGECRRGDERGNERVAAGNLRRR